MFLLGIDDAGRGPLIGPMILAGVLIEPAQESFLKKERIRDSKIVAHVERVRLEKIIKGISSAWDVQVTYPEDIDFSLKNGVNLNTLEAIKAAAVINSINQGKFRKEKIKVVIDCPSVNIAAWGKTLMEYVEYSENLKVVCEHKADANHVVVSAASILAKVVREEEVAKIKKMYGEIGSGYPSDPVTQQFLKSRGRELRDSGIFRKSWGTWKKLFPEDSGNQKTLGDF